MGRPMGKKTKSNSAEFKLNAVDQMAQAKTISGLAKELRVYSPDGSGTY